MIPWSVIYQAFFWYGLALIMSAIEVESEGEYGWAYKTPTWYRKTGFAAHMYGLVMAGKPLTGYHTFMFALPLFIFHAQFVMGIQWTLINELLALAAYFLVCPFWDFLWFVLNPYYGIRRFQKKNIWWHAESMWIWRVPMDYFIGVGISILCAYGASALIGKPELFIYHLITIGILIAILVPFTALCVAPLYHRWYWRMRRHDDRSITKIFYNSPDKPLGKE